MDRIEIFKENYHKELESREYLQNRFSTNVTIVTLLLAALLYCIKNAGSIEYTKYFYSDFFWIFYISLIFSVATSIYIIVILLINLLGAPYKRIPSSQILNSYYQDLVKYYEDYPEAEGNPDSEFEKSMTEYYIEIGTYNMEVNEKRTKNIGNAHIGIIVLAVTILISLMFYVPTFLEKDANVQKFEIVDPSTPEDPATPKEKDIKENFNVPK
ncbi:hypothetical protein RG959_21175 [Domibacillus sp. 8LH]|uniref:hypothetical protein n=1 Tax=Domibacillus sp. 8LH TaxID=3073900 RepID=UPI00316B1CF5